MTLFFFPHAGGSAKSYASFKRFLPKSLNVVTMELSGRFTRAAEPLVQDIPAGIRGLFDKYADLPALLEGGYAVFGHSMGTVLATEFVRQAREQGYPAPVHAFLSGKTAPDEALHCFGDISRATDEEIIAFFSQHAMNTPMPVQDEELLRQLNRILCNDVRMVETYRLTAEEMQFGCPLTVICGTEDLMLQNADMSGWGRFTDKSCETVTFSGGHFYYTEHKPEVCRILCERLGIVQE